MRIDGEWYPCDDGFVRPVIRGEIEVSDGRWEPARFLLDTGAVRTVLCADILETVEYAISVSEQRLGGVGGLADSVELLTRLRFVRDDGAVVELRGQFAALTDPEALDMCVLGRDITDMFAVIVDRPGDTVAMIARRHRYAISRT